MCNNESRTLHGSVLDIVWCSFLCMSFSWMWWFCLSIGHCGRLEVSSGCSERDNHQVNKTCFPNGQGMCGWAFSSQILNCGHIQGCLVHIPVYEMKMSRSKMKWSLSVCRRITLTVFVSFISWVLAYIMTESSCFFQACSRNSKCRLVLTLAFTQCRELMKSEWNMW
jgi:hypothetical protein